MTRHSEAGPRPLRPIVPVVSASRNESASDTTGLGWSVLRFDADVIIDCDAQFVLAAEVLLGRLHADMPEEEPNLLQFASRHVAQTGHVRRRS